MSNLEGASVSEQLIESARRNNVELLEEILQDQLHGDATKIAAALNDSKDPLGNTVLHLAALIGSYEVLDHILDQEGVEVDPQNMLQGDTPLHCAVKYSKDEPEHGAFIAEMLIEAGSDPRIKNKHGQKPIDLADKSNDKLIQELQAAEYAHMFGGQKEQPEEVVDETATPDDAGSDSE